MNKNWLIFWSLGFSCLTLPVFAGNKLANFLDTNGIDALKLHQAPYNLTGRKIAIGQVEIGRPGMFGWDKAVSKNRSVSPLAVFLRNAPAKSNIGVDPHAYNVSGVMVSQDKAFPGVAPNARLYSSAVGSVKKIGQPEECLSAQHIALQNGGDVRAINFSFGEPLDRDPRPEAILDGNALLTLCIDWSSSVHDVVYSIAGNQGKGGIPIPTDNFNAINVAFSSEQKGIFNKVHVSNLTSANQAIENRLAGKEFNLAGRSAISLVAPGTNIPLLNPDGKLNKSTGTSFAAPQVTATVALLQEFVDKQLRTKQPHWTINARRHQVMKAILLNSADKIKDSGDGLRLGMTRTLIDKQNLDWLATAAYKNAKIPLDAQMGAGHLNAFRAYQQLNGGEWKPTLTVPPIGWDYGIINTNSSQEYALEKSLKKNSFVAITLSWDRLVELNDKNNNQQYDLDETFVNKGLNDLDVYLVQENGKNDQVVVCASMSELDSIEHIFCPVPTHGNYKIRVQFKKQINKPTQSYALAWWTVPER
ncbi:MAG: peptidase S8 and S53 subtilisin kexin sedolisin [Aphanizomenon flos-aquae MDT14a]|jgi:subtilisin family serine protease|nr:MAG: peptidase S8 and S53 subtilisin kexin sedolisin [Aphanizomenon flos-aquae MDT14a]